jgi:RsiW-degrading membrane proteinase PrsW (M82 family)
MPAQFPHLLRVIRSETFGGESRREYGINGNFPQAFLLVPLFPLVPYSPGKDKRQTIMLRLIIQSGSLAGRQFQLEPGERSWLLIGRSEESAVRLAEPGVSPRHAIIAAAGSSFYLLDQRSANGTWVNGERVEQAKLRDGDLIELGAQGPRLQVELDGQATARINAGGTSGIRSEVATSHYYAPPTTRLGLHDTAHNLGLYNPYYDTGKSKRSPGVDLMWLVCTVLGVAVVGLTVLDVGLGNALVGGVAAFIPAALYLAIFLWLDRYDPEPPETLCFALVWGAAIAVFVSAMLNGIATLALGDLLTGIVSAPVVEEAAKGLGVLMIAFFFRKDFDSVVDGIVYAGVVALGFATMENVDYYGRSLAEGGPGTLAGTFIVRGILSPFSHVLFTCMTGIGVGVARETHNPAVKVAAPMIGYFGAMFLHALWNTLASFDGGTFFTGYFLLEVPLFAVFIAVIFHLVRREGRILKQTLAAEVERGLITQRQLEIAISVFRRTGWTAAAFGNPGLFNARRRFLRAVAKLGLCHWHRCRAAEAAGETDSFPLINQLQAEVFSLRDRVG